MKSIPKISEAEWLVMKFVWTKKRATTNEVVDALTLTTAWKPKTIMTLLKRLATKGALDFEKKGRVFEYLALISESECLRAENQSFVKRVYGGAVRPMLANFIETSKLSKSDIEELKALLEKRGK